MTTTPAKNKTTEKRARTGTYLPTLPEGWTYSTLLATGPDGSQVTVEASSEVSGSYNVTVVADDIDKRRSVAPTLNDAVQSVKASAKALAKITQAEAEARKAREEGLDALGLAGDDEPEPTSGETGEGDETTPDPTASRPDDSTRL